MSEVFGGEVVWVADPDPGASAILAHRFPGVPNLGDIKTVNWADVPPVDIYIGGYPCQPFSDAGQQKGTTDERHIWPWIAGSLRVLRPALAVFENVPGHLRRGFDTVLADLAHLGLDAEWDVASAADVGGPHLRKRLFFLAAAQDAHRAVGGERRLPAPGQAQGRRARPDTGGRGGAPAAHADRDGREEQQWGEPGVGARRDADGRGPQRWGRFGPAIARWEAATGRPAPWATDDRGRLNPAFVEWMMGLPAGWVTAVPGLTRTQQLRALGNGVVPRQAATALHGLAARMFPMAVAA
ncbi:DNA cytosine methyltransferase [Streptomyces xiamenensis]|uniref:DNA cytosine methyltransferase n=1 Tax=Streptomyces xiamenensis TaxID=408015 RepID=UPI0035DA995A